MPEIELDSATARQRWIEGLDIKTALLILTLIVSWAGSYFSMSARVEDQSRRLSNLEAQLVPRSEQLVRDTAITDQLKEIKTTLRDIQARLEK